MSFHNTVEVKDEARPYTRDRFGKKHSIDNILENMKLTNEKKLIKKILAGVLFLIIFGGPMVWAEGVKKTNISIDSTDLGPLSINDKIKTKQDKPTLALDENVALGLDDDGNPNVGMRF